MGKNIMNGFIDRIVCYDDISRIEILIAKSDMKIDWTKLVGKTVKIEVIVK